MKNISGQDSATGTLDPNQGISESASQSQLPEEVPITKAMEESAPIAAHPDSITPEVADKQEKNKDEIFKDLAKTMVQEGVKELDPAQKAIVNVMSLGPDMVESAYNFGVDLINFADKKFGDGKDFIEHSDRVAMFQPQDDLSVMGRSAAKLIIGYSGALKGLQSFTGQGKGLARISQTAASGFMAEMALLKPQGTPLLKQFLEKVPVANEWLDYMHAEGDVVGLERRLENSLYGAFEGEFIDGLMRVAKVSRAAWRMDDNFVKKMMRDQTGSVGGELPPPVPKTGDVPVKETPANAQELPPIPGKAVDDIDVERSRQMLASFREGKGNPNAGIVAEDDMLNLITYSADDDTRRLISLVVENNKEEFARIKTTDPELVELAQSYDMGAEELLNFEVQAGFPRGTILAAKSVHLEAAGALKVLAEKRSRGEITKGQFAQAHKTFESLTSQVKDMGSLTGAMLREQGMAAKSFPTEQRMKDLGELFGDDTDAVAEYLAKEPTRREEIVKAFSEQTQNALDMLTQIRYAGLLSSPITHARNIYGGVTTTMIRPAETTLAATFNAITPGNRGVTFGDAWHETVGGVNGTMEAIQIVGKKLRGADAQFAGTNPKRAKLPQFKRDQLRRNKNKYLQAMTEVLGSSKVGQTLQFEDDFVKHINARMTQSREAYRKGREARKAGSNSEEVAAIIQEELNNPSKTTLNKMYHDAEVATFTNEVQGPVLKSLSTAANTPLGKLVAPFANVNLNVMSYTLQRVPVARWTLKQSRQEIFSSNPEVRQRASAKMLLSSGTLGSLAFYLHSKDAIIGSGTTNNDKRRFMEANGYQVGSVKIGDNWVEYRKETPVGAILSFMADMAALTDALPEDEQYVVDDLGKMLVATVSQLYNPEFLTDSVAQLSEAFVNPDKKAGKAAMEYGAKTATSFLPYSAAFRHFNRAFGDGEKSETYTPASILNTTMNQINEIYRPYLNATKRNIIGQPIMHKQGLGHQIINPFGVTPESKDPVTKELARLADVGNVVGDIKGSRPLGKSGSTMESKDIGLGVFKMPPKSIVDPMTRETVKLSTSDYEKLVLYVAGVDFEETENGLKAKALTSKSLQHKLKDIIEKPYYKNKSDALKIDMLKTMINGYKQMGITKFFFQNDDFSKEYKDMARKRMEEIKLIYKDELE